MLRVVAQICHTIGATAKDKAYFVSAMQQRSRQDLRRGMGTCYSLDTERRHVSAGVGLAPKFCCEEIDAAAT
jgi:hypothetical protein